VKKKYFQGIFALLLSFPVLSQTFQEQIETMRQNHDLMGGIALVICNGEITESVPFGLADLGRNIPVTEETVFRVASISKIVTALAFMQLVEQGLVSLDADIGTLLGFQVRNPNFPEVGITPRMLLSHTSSIRDGSTYNNFLSATFSQSQVPPLNSLLSPGGSFYSSGQFFSQEPGSYFTYANVNYGIIGTLVEIITETRFDIYCRDNILLPLGIQGSFLPTELPDINQVAVLYRKANNSWVPQTDHFQGVYPSTGNLDSYVMGTNGFRLSPQGGLRATGNDLGKILLMLIKKGEYDGVRILEKSTVNEILSSQWHYNGNNGNNYYGLFRSWGLGIHRVTGTPGNDVIFNESELMLGHSGEAYGLVSNAYIDTLNRTGLVFMTNGNGSGYTTNTLSAFYTVENDVFNLVEEKIETSQCSSVGYHLPEEQGNAPKVFPNPAGKFIEVQGNLLYQTKFSILNKNEEILKNGSLSVNQNRIDIKHFCQGIYFPILEQKPRQVFKFIKLQQSSLGFPKTER
jgi:CubicO group peptidase (beta-lactamase class C family)